MPAVKEKSILKALAFTKKKTQKSSFQAKIEKANDLLSHTVFLKKEDAISIIDSNKR